MSTDLSAKNIQAKRTLLINMNNDIISFLLLCPNAAVIEPIVNHLFDLCLMGQQALKPEDMETFIQRSEKILAASLSSLH